MLGLSKLATGSTFARTITGLTTASSKTFVSASTKQASVFVPKAIQDSDDENNDAKQNEAHLVRRRLNTLINIVPEGTSVVMRRLGKFHSVKNPGLFFAIPFVDELVFVDRREAAITILPQKGVTKDNVSVTLTGQVYIEYVNAERAVHGAVDSTFNILSHAQSSMRSAVGQLTLNDIFHDRTAVNLMIVESISEAALAWGAKVKRYEIVDVSPDEAVLQAMDLIATSERRRQEQVKNAEGAKAEMVLMSEGKLRSAENEALGATVRAEAEAKAKAFAIETEALATAKKIELEGEARGRAIHHAYFGEALGLKAIADEQLANVGSEQATRTLLASKYIDAFAKIAGTNSSVVVPTGIHSDLASFAATLSRATKA